MNSAIDLQMIGLGAEDESMSYDCGDPGCTIQTSAGKEFERVVAYSMSALQTVFDLAAVQSVKIPQSSFSIEATQKGALQTFLQPS